MKKGKLIVIEGACDGIGKSTQYELLFNHLVTDGNKVFKHHFPSYGSVQASVVEEYLKGNYGNPKELSPYFVNSLYALDRGVTWYTELKPVFEEAKVILLDRYTTSSIIYQSAVIEDLEERKKFIDYVMDFEYNKIGIHKPDEVIFLTAPFDLVTQMRQSRVQNDGVDQDIYEKNLELMKKIYENALFVADYLSWTIIECSYDGKMRNIEDIHEEIYRRIK